MKSLAIINSSAPFGSIDYRESLDIALANASYDRPIALFFTGEGLYQIIKGTDATLTGNKELSKTFGLLSLYDVEDIYLCQDSMDSRGLSADELILNGKCLTQANWFSQLAHYDQVLNF